MKLRTLLDWAIIKTGMSDSEQLPGLLNEAVSRGKGEMFEAISLASMMAVTEPGRDA